MGVLIGDMMEAPPPGPMETLFAELRGCFYPDAGIAQRLPPFLDALRECGFGKREAPSAVSAPRSPAPVALAEMLEALDDPLKAAERTGMFGNPWTAAALRRDEVRNASVLAWFLDPRGGHGHGDALLRNLLAAVGRRMVFPNLPSRSCTVIAEDCPDGFRANRVDIRIDDPGGFFLIIEVKIGAPEQTDQLERYCRVAQARACDGRPWAVVFLTPGGRPPVTAGEHGEKVVPLAWSAVAGILRRLAATSRRNGRVIAPSYMANAFAAHISRF